MNRDDEHLQILSVFHYVVGGLAALASAIPGFYMLFGLLFLLAPGSVEVEEARVAEIVGWAFILVPGVLVLAAWVFAGCVIAAGRCLARRTRYMFCLVMAGIECLFMPMGTILGIFSIIVLVREPVKAQFETEPLEEGV
jgi:hypothetical protein